uniref:TIR domain-containing protein n=1 Tax=Solanum lycopersicum TaxID=4081 RepID=A0A3Q7HEP6_SOLLC
MFHASSKVCKYDIFLSFRAIEDARFAVVVFSKSYASSRWCLEELAHIIKCKNELEQAVIPVFYDVSPADVCHQNSPFADSFFQHEAECVKKLVDDIFPKSLQIISPFPESLVGMRSQVEEVIELLSMESNDARSIGISGMGGIGKSELARVLYERYRHLFEADCFLGDVGELHHKNGLAWLAQVVIRKLLGEKISVTSEHEGMIILVGGTEWFGMGSRIILTSRDKHLLISHVGDNVYEVQLLSEDEALELFSRHAFREKSPKEGFMEFSREVVKHAGGLPLALKVLGSSFYRRDKKHWRHIIDRLKRIPHKDILGKLRLSFDGLDKDEKELFLDITFLNFAFLDMKYLARPDFDLYMELLQRDPNRDFLKSPYRKISVIHRLE